MILVRAIFLKSACCFLTTYPGEVIDNLVVANGNVSESPKDNLVSSIVPADNISGKKHKLEEADENDSVSAVSNPRNRIRYDDEDEAHHE